MAAAFLFVVGIACTMIYLADRDCKGAACEFPLVGWDVLALAGVVSIVVASIAISFFAHRDWNSVD
ncbi:MAG TPA: hypothetical protein VGG79_13520 [Roseiarcus sp.]